jgi:opacity protein-like surface antigen
VKSSLQVLLFASTFALLPGVARADILLTPFAGLSFVDDESRGTFGAALGFGGLITFEADVARVGLGTVNTPSFDLRVHSTSYMGNVMLRPPVGPVQPYGIAGVGLLRLAGQFTLPFEGQLEDASRTRLAYAIGGGVMLFFSPNVGLRADFRYVRPVGGLRVSDLVNVPSTGDVPPGQLDFARATVGLTLRL